MIMARTTEFLELNDYGLGRKPDRTRQITRDISLYLEDVLLDTDFDRIGCLERGTDEYEIYRDLGALPKEHAGWQF